MPQIADDYRYRGRFVAFSLSSPLDVVSKKVWPNRTFYELP